MIIGANAVFITWISSYLCHGRLLWKNEDVDMDRKMPKHAIGNNSSDTKELLNTILDAIENCKQGSAAWLVGQDRLPPCTEQVESLVVDLPQDKRNALKEILSLALTPGVDPGVHKNDEGNSIIHTREKFQLSPGHSISAEQLLWDLIVPNTTTAADLNYLQHVIYGGRKHDLKEDAVVMKAVDNFLRDISMNHRGAHHFA